MYIYRCLSCTERLYTSHSGMSMLYIYTFIRGSGKMALFGNVCWGVWDCQVWCQALNEAYNWSRKQINLCMSIDWHGYDARVLPFKFILASMTLPTVYLQHYIHISFLLLTWVKV